MIDKKTIEQLRKKYNDIPPLIFHRSVERAESGGDLFDILDFFPEKYPVIWDEKVRKWSVTEDLTQVEKFQVN